MLSYITYSFKRKLHHSSFYSLQKNISPYYCYIYILLKTPFKKTQDGNHHGLHWVCFETRPKQSESQGFFALTSTWPGSQCLAKYWPFLLYPSLFRIMHYEKSIVCYTKQRNRILTEVWPRGQCGNSERISGWDEKRSIGSFPPPFHFKSRYRSMTSVKACCSLILLASQGTSGYPLISSIVIK